MPRRWILARGAVRVSDVKMQIGDELIDVSALFEVRHEDDWTFAVLTWRGRLVGWLALLGLARLARRLV